MPSTPKRFFPLPVSSTRARLSAPLWPRPGDHGRRQGRVPSLSLSWQTGSSHYSTVIPIDDSSNPWLEHTLNCRPLEEHHYAEDFTVNASFKTDDPPLWSGLLTPRTYALRRNRRICLNCREDNHPFENCRHPFIAASGCLDPELGQLGDDDAHRFRRTRTVCYR